MKVDIEVEEHPELDDCMSAEEFVELWEYARLRTREEMLGLLAFGEMMERTSQPLTSFASSMLMWLDVARQEIARASEEAADDAVVH